MCLWNVKDIFGASPSANTTHIIGCKFAGKVIQIEQWGFNLHIIAA